MPGFYSVKDWVRWLRSLGRARGKAYRHGNPRKNPCRLSVEELETRLAPADYTWSGGGGLANKNWTAGANWVGGMAPTGTIATMDNLIFGPSGTTQKDTFNDFPSAVFNSITFATRGYTLAGNQITLGDPSVPNGGFIIVNSNAQGETISLDIQMGGAAGNRQFFTVNSGGELTFSGKLSGTTGSSLSKDGVGILLLTNDNSAFTGPIDVGAGIVQITHAKALADTTGVTTIDENAQLQINGPLTAAGTAGITEKLIVSGTGISQDGAVKNVAGNNTWSGTVELDKNAGFGVLAGVSSLKITGQVSDRGAGHNLIKVGPGPLIFTAANTYRGMTIIDDGTLEIQNALALGAADNTATSGTFVNKSVLQVGMLKVNDPTGAGFTIANELLTLNFTGIPGPSGGTPLGALYVTAGEYDWTGDVILGSPAPNGYDAWIGTAEDCFLTISGLVKDPNGIYNLTKVGFGELILPRANTYRGSTTVAAGIVNIRDSEALGDPIAGAGTTVLDGATLALSVDDQLDSVTGDANALTIREDITITGTGTRFQGALDSVSGVNVIESTVRVGGPPNPPPPAPQLPPGNGGIGVEADTRDATVIFQNALGKSPQPLLTFVNNLTGATLASPPQPATPTISITHAIIGEPDGPLPGTNAMQLIDLAPPPGSTITGGSFILRYNTNTGSGPPVFIDSPAIAWNANPATLAANIQAALDALLGAGNTLVESHPSINDRYFPTYDGFGNAASGDWSLTVTLVAGGGLDKLGAGQLILPNPNTYAGTTTVQAGWITVGDNVSLGPTPPNVTETLRPPTTVFYGAGLHLRPKSPGASLDLENNFVLSGIGVAHPYSVLNREGAILSLGGVNTLLGNIVLNSNAGIGVHQAGIELIDPVLDDADLEQQRVYDSQFPSQLRTTNSVSEARALLQVNTGSPAVNSNLENSKIIDLGDTGGTIVINSDLFSGPDSLRVYLGPRGTLGSQLLYNSDTGTTGPTAKHAAIITINFTPTTATSTVVLAAGKLGFGSGYNMGGTINYTANNSTQIEIVINSGGYLPTPQFPRAQWQYSAQITPNNPAGGLVKLGPRRLAMQADGTYSGPVNIAEGVLRIQHETALGLALAGAVSTTTVQPGTALELAAGLASENGGVAAGLQVWNERLVLAGAGNAFYGDTATLVNSIGTDRYGNEMTGDNMWRGPVTLNATAASVTFQNALGNASQPTMTADGANLTPASNSPRVQVDSLAAGGSGENAVQSILFGAPVTYTPGAESKPVTGGTFTLTYNGTNGTQTTGPIAFSANATTLANNIQVALDALLGAGNTLVTPSPTIDIRQGTRLTLFGAIDDNLSPDRNGSDLNLITTVNGGVVTSGGGGGTANFSLWGTSTFHGTTYADDGIALTIGSGQALGNLIKGAVQSVTLSGDSTGTFTLAFKGAQTSSLPFAATAADVEAALKALSTIAGADVGGSVSVTRSGDVFTVSFLGNLAGFSQPLLTGLGQPGTSGPVDLAFALVGDGGGGTIIAPGATIQLQGNITVPGEPLQIQSQGVAAIPGAPYRWFQTGPAPAMIGQTPGAQNVAGRITGVSVDPQDPNVIYVSTPDGGVWKTKNSGQSWLPLLDDPTAQAAGLDHMHIGAIAVAPTDPTVIYLGTGEANNSIDSYAGSGIYKSTDSGITWSLVTGSGANVNPFDNKTIVKIVVDPVNKDIIYAAVSDLGIGTTPGNAGIWRYNGFTWTNLTALPSFYRAVLADDAPLPPGPDDNQTGSNTSRTSVKDVWDTDLMNFYQTNAMYSDVQVWQDPLSPGNRFIVFAQGTPDGGVPSYPPPAPGQPVIGYDNGTDYRPQFSNAVYISVDSGNSWLVGNTVPPGTGFTPFPTTDERTVTDPCAPPFTVVFNVPHSGVVKIGMGRSSPTALAFDIYAAISYPSNGHDRGRSEYAFRELWRTRIVFVGFWGIDNWNLLADTAVTGGVASTRLPEYLSNRGDFASSVFVNPANGNEVWLAGTGNATGQNIVLRSTDRGASFTDVTLDLSSSAGGEAGPHPGAHGMTLDRNGRLLLATDGGLFRAEGAGGAALPASGRPTVWNNLNGNRPGASLANHLVYSVAVDPSDPNRVFAGSQNNGMALYDGTPDWTFADDATASAGAHRVSTGGEIQIDPIDPDNVYAFQTDGTWGYVRRSTTGGDPGTWSSTGPLASGRVSHPTIKITFMNLPVLYYIPAWPGNGFYNWRQLTVTNNLTGTNPQLFASTLVHGSDAVYDPPPIRNEVQLLTFDGSITGGSFRLTMTDPILAVFGFPGGTVTSLAIAWSNDPYRLAKNIQDAWDYTCWPPGLWWFYDMVVVSVVGTPPDMPLVLDPINTNRLLVGTAAGAYESFDQGNSWRSLYDNGRDANGVPLIGLRRDLMTRLVNTPPGNPPDGFDMRPALGDPVAGAVKPLVGPAAVSGIAIPQYQGDFVPDADFPQVFDLGANTNDKDTIYVVMENMVWLTKNHGLTWVPRSAASYDVPQQPDPLAKPGGTTTILTNVQTPLPDAFVISDIQVDPTNRDTVYVISSVAANSGIGRVYVTTDAGFTWTDMSAGLPDIPVWKLVQDSRSGNFYAGTDQGVYQNVGGFWTKFSHGMPLVQVKDLALNQSTNTLTAATYGRGTYTFYLDETRASAGVMTSVSGSGIWTGPLILPGDTVISARGTQTLQNGVAAATLNIVGTISDLTAGANYSLTKIGFGNVILSGANVYGGTTTVDQGVLIVRNNHALGLPGNGTTVREGTALELQSSIVDEPLFLNGDGFFFNGRNQGALRNTSNDNTYSGPITLETNSTIAADSATILTVTGSIGDGADDFTVTKEGTGTLILAQADTYSGGTHVFRGILQAANNEAVGNTPGAITTVYNGAKLQLSGNISVPTTQVLHASGTGTVNTGAVESVNGTNTWQGPITLMSLTAPGSGPDINTTPIVNFGAMTASDTLRVGSIDEQADPLGPRSFGITKVGAGKVVFQEANAYTGTTTVSTGIVALLNSQGLGNPNVPVTAEVQTVTVTGTSGTFRLTFNGQTTALLPFNASDATVKAALDGLSTIGAIGGSVNVSKSTIGGSISTYTITFEKTLAGFELPQIIAEGGSGANAVYDTTTNGTGSTIVAAGATLQLDLDPTNTGQPQTVSNEPLWLLGSGVGAKGALENVSGVNTWSTTPILLRGDTTIGVDAGSLTVDADLAGVAANQAFTPVLTKVGPGILDLKKNNSFPGTTIAQQGKLLANGPNGANTIGPVILDKVGAVGAGSATIGGNGTVATITSAAGGGTVFPGDDSANPGTLTSTTVTWNNATTFFVALNGTGAGQFSKLVVNGTVNLGDAILDGDVGLPTNVGDTFIIIQATGMISGTLVPSVGAGNIVFIDGYKFSITITNSGATHTVTLVRLGANTTTTVASSKNPSVFGENVTFTATVISESGGAPSTGTVAFIIDGTTAASAVPLAGTMATYQTSTLAVTALPHSVVASFSDPTNNFISSSGALAGGQTVRKANSKVTVSSSVNPSSIGEMVTFTANVSAVSPGLGIPVGVVHFLVDGKTVAGNVILAGGQATFQTSALSIATHSVIVKFSDTDGQFNGSSGGLAGGQTVRKASSSVAVSSSLPGGSTFGQMATFTAVVSAVSPATGTPAGKVHFIIDGTTVASNVSLSSGQATYKTSKLNVAGSPHAVAVKYVNSNGKFSNSKGSLAGGQSVTPSVTAVAVNSSVNPTVFGQKATFTAVVSAVSPGSGTPSGKVNFIIDSTTVAANVSLSSGKASYQTSTLTVTGSPHSVTVSYASSSANYQNSSGGLAGGQTVTKANSSVAVSSSKNPSVFGDNVTFTAAVSAVSPAVGTPAGTVDFIIDGATAASGVSLVNGKATYQTSTLDLAGSPHSVSIEFNDTDGNFQDSSGALAGGQVVRSATTTTLSTTNANAVYGQATITATIGPVAPGSGTPTGTVTFHVTKGSTTSHTTVALSGGVGTLTPALKVGTYSITASYNDDADFAPSNTTAALSQTVTKANSALAVDTSVNPSVYGQTVTFTASVSAVSPGAGTPAGKVNFIIDGTTAATGVTLTGGKATYKTSSLSVSGSPHAVSASFTATDGNFNNSSNALAGGQTVIKADTTVAVSSSKNPSTLGSSVTFTASVKAASPGSGTPAGTVDFIIDGATTITKTLVGGKAGYATSSLTDTGSPHSIDLVYHNTDGKYNDNTGALSGGQTVLNVDHLGASKPAPAVNVLFSITVVALASNGAVVPAYTGTATIEVLSTPPGGTLSGPRTASFVKGKATFKDLKANKVGTYIIKITTSTGLEITIEFTTKSRWS